MREGERRIAEEHEKIKDADKFLDEQKIPYTRRRVLDKE
jgi:hypothetical protein